MLKKIKYPKKEQTLTGIAKHNISAENKKVDKLYDKLNTEYHKKQFFKICSFTDFVELKYNASLKINKPKYTTLLYKVWEQSKNFY